MIYLAYCKKSFFFKYKFYLNFKNGHFKNVQNENPKKLFGKNM